MTTKQTNNHTRIDYRYRQGKTIDRSHHSRAAVCIYASQTKKGPQCCRPDNETSQVIVYHFTEGQKLLKIRFLSHYVSNKSF